MLDRLYGIAALECSWLPKAGAVALLCSTGLSSAVAQQPPRRLSPEMTASVAPVLHTDEATVKRLPPVNDGHDAKRDATATLRVAQSPMAFQPTGNFGWSTPGGPTGTLADASIKRLPPVRTAARPQSSPLSQSLPSQSQSGSQSGTLTLPTVSVATRAPRAELPIKRLPPVASLENRTDEPRVKRLPPVAEVASLPSHALPSHAMPYQPASSYAARPYPTTRPTPSYQPVSGPALTHPSTYPTTQRDVPQREVPADTPQSSIFPQREMRHAPVEPGYGSSGNGTSGYGPSAYDAAADYLPTPQPTRELQAVCGRADTLVRRGFSMAGRGAIYSARADFTEALSMIAQAVDRQQGTNRRVHALAKGLRAINEAEHFQPIGTDLAADIDIANLVAAHRTEALKGYSTAVTSQMTLSEARDRYHDYAAKQLSIASAEIPVASLALYGLGKSRASQVAERPTLGKIHLPAAMALYQAAALVDQRNYRATNEIGVLSAKLGRHEDARVALQQSVAASPTQESWRNLAVVHRQLGEERLAQLATAEADRTPAQNTARNAHPVMAKSNVRWVSPQEFSQAGAANIAIQKPNASPAPQPTAPQPRSSMSKWLPWAK